MGAGISNKSYFRTPSAVKNKDMDVNENCNKTQHVF